MWNQGVEPCDPQRTTVEIDQMHPLHTQYPLEFLPPLPIHHPILPQRIFYRLPGIESVSTVPTAAMLHPNSISCLIRPYRQRTSHLRAVATDAKTGFPDGQAAYGPQSARPQLRDPDLNTSAPARGLGHQRAAGSRGHARRAGSAVHAPAPF